MGQLEEGTAALLGAAPEQIKIQGARAIHDQALPARSGLQLLQLLQQLLGVSCQSSSTTALMKSG